MQFALPLPGYHQHYGPYSGGPVPMTLAAGGTELLPLDTVENGTTKYTYYQPPPQLTTVPPTAAAANGVHPMHFIYSPQPNPGPPIHMAPQVFFTI